MFFANVQVPRLLVPVLPLVVVGADLLLLAKVLSWDLGQGLSGWRWVWVGWRHRASLTFDEAVLAAWDSLGSACECLIVHGGVAYLPVQIPPCQFLPPVLPVVGHTSFMLKVPGGSQDGRLIGSQLCHLVWIPGALHGCQPATVLQPLQDFGYW